MHRALSAYIAKEHGRKITPQQVQVVLRAYPLFLKTDEHQARLAEERDQREAERKARAERKAERQRKRLARLNEQRKRLLEQGVQPESDASDPFDGEDDEPTETDF